MKFRVLRAFACALLLGVPTGAFADNVRTDFDHQANFSQYHTYSWGTVKTSDPFYVSRIQQAVNKQLQAKGWQLVPSGGAVTVFANDKLHNQKETQTMYDGFGGGWGSGWNWDGWGWGGGWTDPAADPVFGTSTTTTNKQQVSNLVIDLFDGSSKKLLWRGLATADLSTNANKNTNSLNNDINKMFHDFPPKPGK